MLRPKKAQNSCFHTGEPASMTASGAVSSTSSPTSRPSIDARSNSLAAYRSSRPDIRPLAIPA
ncbi:MAG: hypothetical protein ACKPBU_11300, partial [Alphaproteobacteria bacterium]